MKHYFLEKIISVDVKQIYISVIIKVISIEPYNNGKKVLSSTSDQDSNTGGFKMK